MQLCYLVCFKQMHQWLYFPIVLIFLLSFTYSSAFSYPVEPLDIICFSEGDEETQKPLANFMSSSLSLVDEIPTITVRFANPQYDCVAEEYCLDVEFQSDIEDQELFGMNVRFFYLNSELELINFRDYQGGYGPVAPNPPTVLTSGPAFGYDFFRLGSPGNSAADWVNGAIQLVDMNAPPLIISTTGWTKLFQICFHIDDPSFDSLSFCPPIVWDLELDPANGGYLAGDNGVVITVVNDPPATSGPSNENVVQFNWEYTGDGSAPPYGQPIELECIAISCGLDIVCPADIIIDCDDSTLPANTGTATSDDNCPGSPVIAYSDSIAAGSCGDGHLIYRTWTATDSCANSSSCVQVITIDDRGMICGTVFNDLGQAMQGVQLRLMADINANEFVDAGDTLYAITYSDSITGEYCFDLIEPCTYVIEEVQPLYHSDLFDYDLSPDPDGNDSIDGPDNEIPVFLAPCEIDSSNNFVDIVCPGEFPFLAPDTICENDFVEMEIVDLNIGLVTYAWDFGSGSTPPTGTGLGPHVITYVSTLENQSNGALVDLTISKEGCADTTAQIMEVQINVYPDATINGSTSPGCYFTNRVYQPNAPEISGATYMWNFGEGAIPELATGYGPHTIYYDTAGVKVVSLAIYPNADGAQCPDSSSISFIINNCPANILGKVESTSGAPIADVNIRLFADENVDGIADNGIAIKSVFSSQTGNYSMASVTPGNYVIVEMQPSGWISIDDGDPTPDNDIVSNIDSLDNLIPVTLITSEIDQLNYFIEAPIPGTISGSVFVDFDGDEIPDPEEGLSNVTISLFHDANTNGIADDNIPVYSVLTLANGSYSIPNVPVGHYVLAETQPAGYASVKDFDASNDADVVPNTNMLNDTIPVSITNGEVDSHNYFIDSETCGLIVTTLADSGPGSFRYAIDCAEDGDTISFHANLEGDTIVINSERIVINKNITIYSVITPRITLASQVAGFFDISNVANVEFRWLYITTGLAGNDGAAFNNEGNLHLNEIHVRRNPFLSEGEYLIYNVSNGQLLLSGNCFIEAD